MNTFLIITAAILVILLYMYFEAGWLKVSRIDFTKSCKGLKILHISDVHINMLRVGTKRVKELIRQEDPDIILMTGDYIEKPVHASVFLDFLQKIKLSNKTYICLGNHDYKAYKGNNGSLEIFIKEIKNLHVEVLINSSAHIEKNSFSYNLIGIDDLREGNPNIEKAVEGCSPAATNIAFSHNPDMVLNLSRKHADYFFCGHFHGGQIWMPFGLEYTFLRKDKLCRMGIKRGLHKINGITAYLNRGLGNVEVPFRFFSRPEISIYNIP
ncbi:MAG: metallophosphoesterase [Ruminiclostridium sp.]|nr:metallophosphoesterase [Ruminiclostridium sp.]